MSLMGLCLSGTYFSSTMKKLGIFLSFLAIFFSAACTSANDATPTTDVNAIYTMAAKTVVAELTGTAAVVTPTQPLTSTPLPQETTATPVPTSTVPTATPTLTPSATATATVTPQASPTDEFCDNAAWVADVSVQDGTEMAPGQAFEKTWRIKNTGTCTWEAGYKIAFGYGENMNGQARAINTPVAPNEEIEVTVVFSAPLAAGTYQSYWRMVNAAGINFGEWLYVDIVVR